MAAARSSESVIAFLKWVNSRPLYIINSKVKDESADEESALVALPDASVFDPKGESSEVFAGYTVKDSGQSRYFDWFREIIKYYDTNNQLIKLGRIPATEAADKEVLMGFPHHHQQLMGALQDVMNPYGPVGVARTYGSGYELQSSKNSMPLPIFFGMQKSAEWLMEVYQKSEAHCEIIVTAGLSPVEDNRLCQLDFKTQLKLTADRQADGTWKYFLPPDAHLEVTGPDALLARTLINLSASFDPNAPLRNPDSLRTWAQLEFCRQNRNLFRKIAADPSIHQITPELGAELQVKIQEFLQEQVKTSVLSKEKVTEAGKALGALATEIPHAKFVQAKQFVNDVLDGKPLPNEWGSQYESLSDQRKAFKAMFEAVFEAANDAESMVLATKYIKLISQSDSHLHRLMYDEVGFSFKEDHLHRKTSGTNADILEKIERRCPGVISDNKVSYHRDRTSTGLEEAFGPSPQSPRRVSDSDTRAPSPGGGSFNSAGSFNRDLSTAALAAAQPKVGAAVTPL